MYSIQSISSNFASVVSSQKKIKCIKKKRKERKKGEHTKHAHTHNQKPIIQRVDEEDRPQDRSLQTLPSRGPAWYIKR